MTRRLHRLGHTLIRSLLMLFLGSGWLLMAGMPAAAAILGWLGRGP